MDKVLFSVHNYDVTGKTAALLGATVLTLIALRRYFAGGVCRVSRDLTGKTAVITGGNGGIGEQTALHLAKLNCNVIIGARDKPKLEETLKKIKSVNPKIQANYSCLDLGDRESIKQFSEFVTGNCQQIDFLINNAGVMAVPERRETKDGMEMQIGINHFGHFYLTYLLMPRIRKSPEFRIINLSSLAHKRTSGIDFSDIHSLKNYEAQAVYRKSKLANVYFTRYLQQKFQEARINGKSVCLHPGVVRTELGRYFSLGLRIATIVLYPLLLLIMKNSQQGAQTTLYTVLEDFDKLVGGEYYADCQVAESTLVSKDMQKAKELWEISEKTFGIKFEI